MRGYVYCRGGAVANFTHGAVKGLHAFFLHSFVILAMEFKMVKAIKSRHWRVLQLVIDLSSMQPSPSLSTIYSGVLPEI